MSRRGLEYHQRHNVLAHKVALEIYRKIEGIKEAYVLLLSRIGTPIDKPWIGAASLDLADFGC